MFRSWFIVKTLTCFSTTEKNSPCFGHNPIFDDPKIMAGKNAKIVWFLMNWLISQNCGLPEVNTISV